jgi:acyl-CoA synthetase (AMP-forming)/AMP-acid ligase II
MGMSAIADRFLKTSRDHGGAVAVRTLWDGRALSFDDLREQYVQTRRALVEAGIGPGSCVVSLAGNRPGFFALFVACMDVGAALLPLNEATDAEAAALIDRAAAVAVVSERALPLAAVRQGSLPDGMHVLTLRTRSRGILPTYGPTYGRSVLLKLTSGSTDLPKAAVAGEHHLISDGCHVIEAMGIEPSDVNLAYIPLSHSYAVGNIVMPLIWQGTGVALRQMFNPSQLGHDARVSGASVFPGVPFMFDQIQASPEIDQLPRGLRLLITAGARIDPGTVLWFQERLGRKIHSFYGSSETGGISYDDSEDVSDVPHVGWPMPETTIAIKPVERAEGAGRIFVSGPAVCGGYADDHDSARPGAFSDGGFLTGDAGYKDGRGRVVLTGRLSPLVNVAGRKVDPAEVERVLIGLRDVVEARVLGISCDKRGQQIVAFVVRSSPALTPIAIRTLCAGMLSPYKIPRRFIFLDRLPVDARGKMDRRALEALASTL